MEYTINPETDGICSLSEFMRHDCSNCPKKGMCDFVCEESKRIMEMSEDIENNNRSQIRFERNDTVCIQIKQFYGKM
jgi:hypothetical protein